MGFHLASPILIYAAAGFVVVWLLGPWVATLSRRRATEARSQDGSEVSRFGGIALAAAFLIVPLVGGIFLGLNPLGRNEWVAIFGSLAMFAVGVLDDFRPLGARLKLLGQVVIASVVCLGGIEVDAVTNPITHTTLELGAFSFFVTVFWLVAMTNLINLIDGIDGLAGGIAFMLMCLLAYAGVGHMDFYFLVAVVMAGALLGFIRYNFPPAKIYMGDGGAYFLGFLIGVLTIQSSQKGTVAAALIAPIFALALPIMDVSLAILRRGVKGLPIFRPDKRHIHHRLLASGFSRRKTLLTLYAVSLVCLFMAFGVFWSQGRLAPILLGCLFLLLMFSARSLGLVREWFSPEGTLGNMAQLRKETRYALCLGSWLELEAERCASERELWDAMVFFAGKVGVQRLKLTLTEGELVWQRGELAGKQLHCHSWPVGLGNARMLEFAADTESTPAKVFDHIAELSGEACLKAALRWEQTHGRELHFTVGNA